MEDEEKPIRISWSQIRTHAECRQKSYLHRTGHRNPTADKRNMFPGTVCDRVMRDWLNTPGGAEPGKMSSMVEEILNREEKETVDNGDGIVKWRDRGDKSRILEWCKELVIRLEPALNALVLPYDYEPAKRFVAPLELPYSETENRPVHLIGEIDILVGEALPRYSVWDLKATENDSYYRKTLGQLIFYDLAVQILFQTDPCIRTGLIQPMCKSPVLYFEFSNDDYRQMWARIHRYALDVWRKRDDPKESMAGCNWCDVHHACAKFRNIEGTNKVSFAGSVTLEDLL